MRLYEFDTFTMELGNRPAPKNDNPNSTDTSDDVHIEDLEEDNENAED